MTVWLPAGEVFLTPVPGTANGVVVADHVFYQGDRVEGLRLELKGGKLVGMTAKSGLEPLEEYYKVAGPGKDVFGVVDIGINPAIEVPEGGAVNVWSRAGAVTVGVGNNTWAGGDNRVNFGLFARDQERDARGGRHGHRQGRQARGGPRHGASVDGRGVLRARPPAWPSPRRP